ncbi:MAG: hypothetical protein K0S74_451 [Chlamydiales bacterium]|jgi:hypothetical protein|nr:hypothetical protein [Chlamydiales bacterium]
MNSINSGPSSDNYQQPNTLPQPVSPSKTNTLKRTVSVQSEPSTPVKRPNTNPAKPPAAPLRNRNVHVPNYARLAAPRNLSNAIAIAAVFRDDMEGNG